MTNNNPSAGNAPARLTLAECQHQAVVLEGVVEAISLMDNEGENFSNARTAVTLAALDLAKALANNLDLVEQKDRRHA